jgi:predicted phosphodiesterase
MRIAVLADVHGNLAALEAVLSHLEQEGGCDETWVLGDLAVFGPYPRQVLERLANLPNKRFVQGNTDRYLATGQRPPQPPVADDSDWSMMLSTLEKRDANFRWTLGQLDFRWHSFLSELRFKQRIDVPGFGAILAVHGSPVSDEVGIWAETSDRDLREMLSGAGCKLLLCGHTHRPLDRSLGEVGVVNVGSVGLPLDGDRRAAYCILEVVGGGCDVALFRVEYDVDSVIDKLSEVGHPAADWVGHRLRLAAIPQ